MTTRNLGHAGLLAVATALLVSCGGTGAPGLTGVPSRTAGARPSVTATLPELERSEPRPEGATGTAEPPSPARSVPRPAPPPEIPATTAVPEQQAAGPALAVPPSTTSSPSSAGATAPAESELAATARDDAGRSRALGLRDAVRAADLQLNVLVGARRFDTLAYGLDAVAAGLEAALAEGAGDR